MSMQPVCRCALVAVIALATSAQSANTLVPAGAIRYAPSGFPDRVIAVPATDSRTGFSVAWRTDASVDGPMLQIAEAVDSPDVADYARSVRAVSRSLDGENGAARHHAARIDGLRPDTLYAYRVQGNETWSEWFQIRTAAAGVQPFSFLYFGDAQNSIKSLYSRVIREAWRREPASVLVIHAGDLVDGRVEEIDNEWGEWFDAGGFLNASALFAPASGNHEHRSGKASGNGRHTLEAHWAAQFPVPENGAPGLSASTYFFDYQGVRFITLDSTSALENGTGSVQADWMRPLLENNPNRWTVVTHHHPMFSASLGRDNPSLRKDWMPLFERYGVDLVLQGHDHVYGRGQGTSTAGDKAVRAGPVYVVSVAGAKQYRVSRAAQKWTARYAENTQLYQIVRVSHDQLRYESWTVTGKLYDAFELRKDALGAAQLNDLPVAVATRRCPHDRTRSGRTSRCWDGAEW
jgi:3',5'-cyclic AMP phosphodiesterase CpdA